MQGDMKSTHRPFSPALMGLCGVVVGMCFVVLAFVFVRDMGARPAPNLEISTTPSMESATVSRTEHLAETRVGNLDLNQVVPEWSDPNWSGPSPVSTATRMYAERSFQEQPIRFIRIFHPTDGYSYSVGTQRADELTTMAELGVLKSYNDDLCGEPAGDIGHVCYLFREGIAGKDGSVSPVLLSAWTGGVFGPETAVSFVKNGDDLLMRFSTKATYRTCTQTYAHEIQLKTGVHRVVSQKSSCKP